MLKETIVAPDAVSDEEVAAGESAHKALDALIAFRSKQNERPAEASWKASVRRYNASLEAARRDEWCDYHRQQAARHRATLRDLVAYHETRAALLQATDERKRA